MLKKLSVMIASLIICLPIYAAGTAESLEDGINQLAIDMSKQMQKKGIKKIAIDDFTDLNGYKSGLGDFISEELVTSFYTQGAGNFEVVERRELARVLKEQKLGGSGLLNKSTIAKIGKILGIDAIVTGSIAYLGSSVKVNARMIGVNNAKVFAATSQKMLKDEAVEALLRQGARISNNSSTSSGQSFGGVQIQSHDTKFENKFLRITPKQINVSKSRHSVIIALDFQNLTNKDLLLTVGDKYSNSGASSDDVIASVFGNRGGVIDVSSGSVYVTGLDSTYLDSDRLSLKGNYTTIGASSKTTIIFRFSQKEAMSDNLFSFSANMARYVGKKSYQKFSIGIPNIKLSKQLNVDKEDE